MTRGKLLSLCLLIIILLLSIFIYSQRESSYKFKTIIESDLPKNINVENTDRQSKSLFQKTISENCKILSDQDPRNQPKVKVISIEALPVTFRGNLLENVLKNKHAYSNKNDFNCGFDAYLYLKDIGGLHIYDAYSGVGNPLTDNEIAVLHMESINTKIYSYLAISGDGGFYTVHIWLEGTREVKQKNGEIIYVTIDKSFAEVANEQKPLKKEETIVTILNREYQDKEFRVRFDNRISEINTLLSEVDPKY